MAAGLPNWGEAMKRMLGTFVSAVVVLVVVALPARPAGAEPVADEAQFLVLLNQLRAERGLRPLVSDSQMVGVARQWSARMAAESTLYHNGDLPNQVTNWRMLGENVGVGSDVQQLHNAFVASPHHYENMVEPAFDATGIGVVEGGGQRRAQSRRATPGHAHVDIGDHVGGAIGNLDAIRHRPRTTARQFLKLRGGGADTSLTTKGQRRGNPDDAKPRAYWRFSPTAAEQPNGGIRPPWEAKA